MTLGNLFLGADLPEEAHPTVDNATDAVILGNVGMGSGMFGGDGGVGLSRIDVDRSCTMPGGSTIENLVRDRSANLSGTSAADSVTPSVPVAAPTPTLGDIGMGWGMVGGDSLILPSPDPQSSMLGDFNVGWGMLGGDGPQLVDVITDRHVVVHGTVDVTHVLVLADRNIVVHGIVEALVPVIADRHLVVAGAVTLGLVNRDRRVLLHGTSVTSSATVQRCLTVTGCSTVTGERTFSVTVLIAAGQARPPTRAPAELVAPMTAFYT